MVRCGVVVRHIDLNDQAWVDASPNLYTAIQPSRHRGFVIEIEVVVDLREKRMGNMTLASRIMKLAILRNWISVRKGFEEGCIAITSASPSGAAEDSEVGVLLTGLTSFRIGPNARAGVLRVSIMTPET